VERSFFRMPDTIYCHTSRSIYRKNKKLSALSVQLLETKITDEVTALKRRGGSKLKSK